VPATKSGPIAKDRGDLPGGGIAHADLHDLRRMTSHQSPGEKVVVLRHDEKSLVTGERPDLLIVVRGEPVVANMTASGEARLEQTNQTIGKILVDEGLHATDPNRRRSRSAANARQARMSSDERSGKSATISASVMPEARYSRTSETVIRNPRMQGLPLRLPGSTVMRFKRSEVMGISLRWPIGAGKGGRERCQPPNLGKIR